MLKQHDKETTYSDLLTAFPTLYKELTEVQPKDLITSDQVLSFTSKDFHEESLPKPCVLNSIIECAEKYHSEVISLLTIMLPKFAEGFSIQRGSIFGFGPNSEADTGTICKVATADGSKHQKLEKAPIHNLKEEKSVGEVNYELHIRGREHLQSSVQQIGVE